MRLALKQIIIGSALLVGGQSLAAETDSELIDMSKPVVATVGAIEFRECVLEASGLDREVQCARHQIPEDYANPDGKKIELFIVRLPARKPKQEFEPMLFLAGGPGQAASDGYLHIDRNFPALAKERDFYLVDQRGTGHSNLFSCEGVMESEDLVELQMDPEKIQEFSSKCLEQLPGDPRQYTTSVAIKDFEAVRQALGVEHWNLFGASYGTRVAIHYMRRFPEAVRTAVLDSLVPPDLTLGTEIALLSQAVLSHMYQRCAEDEACDSRFPNLEAETEQLFARLKEGPIEVQAESFSSGQIETIRFTHAHLMLLVRMYLYNSSSLALLPPMLHEAAANDNFAPLARAALTASESMDDMLALGMHNSVMCTEDVRFYGASEDLNRKNQKTYMGTAFLENLQAMCQAWPIGVMDEDFKEPLKSDLPVLLLSGEQDPITPPKYGERVKQHLTNAKHLIADGQGHFVSIQGCAPHLVAKFVSEASVDDLNASCLDRLSAAPLFINFNAPSP